MSREPSDEAPPDGASDLRDRISAAPPRPAPDPSPERERWLHVLALALMAAATIGFFTGTRGEQAPHRPTPRAPAEPAGPARLAPTYAAIREAPLGPGRDRHAAAIAAMRRMHPDVLEEVPPRDDDAVRAELARRATLRAYDGAPPRIPHAIAAFGPLECATCHASGLRVGDRVAPPMSHAELASCTQCHVPDEGEMPGARLPGGPPSESTFAGLAPPDRGPRFLGGAPPQIPHATRMRERCDSCHGVWGTALRSTHPSRQSCTQCHAPSAILDQQPAGLEGGPPVALGAAP